MEENAENDVISLAFDRKGGCNSPRYACRFVVSIPMEKINITNDGIVTLK